VGLDMMHCHSSGPNVRNSSHYHMDEHSSRLVGARFARVCCQFGVAPQHCDSAWDYFEDVKYGSAG